MLAPSTIDDTFGQPSDHLPRNVRRGQPSAGPEAMWPKEYPNAMITKPHVISPHPAPVASERPDFTVANPTDARNSPTPDRSLLGQIVDHVP
jgi:hypothetical protein